MPLFTVVFIVLKRPVSPVVQTLASAIHVTNYHSSEKYKSCTVLGKTTALSTFFLGLLLSVNSGCLCLWTINMASNLIFLPPKVPIKLNFNQKNFLVVNGTLGY